MHSVCQHECKENARNRNTANEFQNTMEQPSRTVVHAKLEMTTPDSAEEVEADAAANDIVQGGKIARSVSSGSAGDGISVSSQMEGRLNSLQGRGQTMPDGLRNMMERGFNRDFSQVRLHTDSEAASLSSSIHAKAFTHGSDIYFNRGQYNPQTTEGQRLVAHELAHVAQGGGKLARNPYVSAKENVDNYKKSLDVYLLLLYVFQKKNIIDTDTKNAKEAEIILKAFFYAHKEDTWYWPMKSYFKEYAKKSGLGSKEKIEAIAKKIDKAGLFVNAPISVIIKRAEDEVGEEIDKGYYERLERELQESGKTIPEFGDNNKEKRKWLTRNTGRIIQDQAFYEAAIEVKKGYEDKEDHISPNLALIAGFKANKVNRPKDYFELPENYVSSDAWTALFFTYSSIPVTYFFSHLAAVTTVAANGYLATIVINTASSIVPALISGIPQLASGEKDFVEVLTDIIISALIASLTTHLGEKLSERIVANVVKDVIASLVTDTLTALRDAILNKDVEMATVIIKAILHAILTGILKRIQGIEDLGKLSQGMLEFGLNEGNSLADFVVDVNKANEANKDATTQIYDNHN